LSLSDSVTGGRVAVVSASDTLVISDSSSGKISAQPSAVDSIAISDIATNGASILRSASDTISLTDFTRQYGGWQTIPNPGQIWTTVSTTITS
jgi:hypothetical protein